MRCHCGETTVELLFNIPRCINPKCRYFSKEYLQRFVFDSDPIHKSLEEYGWFKPFFLGSFGNFADTEATIYDLWYVEPENDKGPCFVAQYGGTTESCYWHLCSEVRELEGVRDMFPELNEAMCRFDILLQS